MQLADIMAWISLQVCLGSIWSVLTVQFDILMPVNLLSVYIWAYGLVLYLFPVRCLFQSLWATSPSKARRELEWGRKCWQKCFSKACICHSVCYQQKMRPSLCLQTSSSYVFYLGLWSSFGESGVCFDLSPRVRKMARHKRKAKYTSSFQIAKD